MKSFIIYAGSLLFTALFYLFWWNTPLLRQLDYKLYDQLNTISPTLNTPDSTVIVDIDDKSLKAFGQWPWPRVITAELINRVADSNPKVIAFDIVFSEPDRTSPVMLQSFYRDFFNLNIHVEGIPNELQDNDQILSDALGLSTTVLPVFSDATMFHKECLLPPSHVKENRLESVKFENLDSMVCSLPLYQQRANAIGHIHAIADSDGALRRLSMFMGHFDELIPSLAIAVLGSREGMISTRTISPLKGDMEFSIGENRFPSDRNANSLLTFYPLDRYKKVSAYDLLSGKVDSRILKNKFVFIGATAMGLDTWHTTGDGTILPGVYIHATALENLLHRELKVQPSLYRIVNVVFSFLIAIILLVMMKKKHYLSILFTFMILVVASFGITYVGWQYNIYLSIGYFIVPLISYLFILSMVMIIIDYRESKRFLEEIQQSSEQKRQLKLELDRSENEIEYQKAMLFQQSKLAAMGEMIDNIAHQWRQPLNTLGVIVQDTQYAHRKGKLDQQYLQNLTSESMEQIAFMSQTIEDFRNFVKPNQKNSPFDLNEPVEQSLQLLSVMFDSHRISIDVEYSNRALEIYGSSRELKQVMINLLNNARDALVERKVENPIIQIRVFGDDMYGAITIQDNGGGILPEHIERIFEPYYTTKEEGKGSGIGLYMSYAIVRTKMGGMIEVENVEEGTLFTIMLPLWRDTFAHSDQ